MKPSPTFWRLEPSGVIIMILSLIPFPPSARDRWNRIVLPSGEQAQLGSKAARPPDDAEAAGILGIVEAKLGCTDAGLELTADALRSSGNFETAAIKVFGDRIEVLLLAGRDEEAMATARDRLERATRKGVRQVRG